MNQKILITGCAGFIGCHLTSYYCDRQTEVIGVDNLSRSGSGENLDWLKTNTSGNFKFYNKDICSFDEIAAIFKLHAPFDMVIHEAAQVAVTTSTKDPRTDFEINALGTFNLLEATRMFSPDAFFQYASTNKVYGKMSSVEVVRRNGHYAYKDLDQGVSEDFQLDFHSPYGCSKGSADQYVRDYHRMYKLRTAVLRQSCIYGTRQFGIEDQGWVAWFTIASILKKPITIYGDGKQTRCFQYVDDLLEGMIRMMQTEDHKNAVEAFWKKEKPVFKGK